MHTHSNNSVYIMGITKIIANQFCNSIHIFCKSVASFKLSAIVYIYIIVYTVIINCIFHLIIFFPIYHISLVT